MINFQSDTYKTDLGSPHFDDKPVVQDKDKFYDQHS